MVGQSLVKVNVEFPPAASARVSPNVDIDAHAE
jgi:hypothetical protein